MEKYIEGMIIRQENSVIFRLKKQDVNVPAAVLTVWNYMRREKRWELQERKLQNPIPIPKSFYMPKITI